MNLDALDSTLRTQPEVNAAIAGGLVASARSYGGKLRSALR